MSKEIQVPDLGEGIESGDVLSILVNVGDTINENDAVLELETDKATVEVPSPEGGTIDEITVKVGDTISAGVVFMKLSGGSTTEEAPVAEAAPAAEEVKEEAQPEAAAPAATTPAATVESKLVLPDLGEGIESGDLLSILASVGETVEKDQAILELETDKATVEVPASEGGEILKFLVKTGDTLKPGDPIAVIKGTGSAAPITEASKAEAPKSAPTTAPAKAAPAPATTSDFVPNPAAKVMPEGVIAGPVIDGKRLVPAAPHVRRFAYEIGIEISEVPGTGPRGRISVDDVKAYSKALNSGKSLGGGIAAKPSQELPDFSKFGEVKREKMSKIRQVTADHMDKCWSVVPHVTQFAKADITGLEALRKQHKERVKEQGGSLTITGILIKVLEMAMKKFPQFNASIDMATQEIVYKEYYNVGVAVETPNGLMVPVIRDVDQKNIVDLTKDLGEMALKARNRQIKPADLSGGSITISNLGGIGGTYFTPIVNWPEVAILGISKAELEPVYIDGEFKPRLRMPLSLSYDHRLIDGADGMRFLNYIIELLENPFVMSLEG